MKIFILLLIFTSCPLSAKNNNIAEQINTVIDQLHQSASQADGKTYFSLFSKNALFIGTDPTETWSIKEFKAFANPYFEQGKGWTYHPRDRHVYVSDSGDTAWFDEMLDNDNYGVTRGTGVLVKVEGGWKIAQYHLTIPIPNELTKKIVEIIQGKVIK